jgi:hypothetical protein
VLNNNRIGDIGVDAIVKALIRLSDKLVERDVEDTDDPDDQSGEMGSMGSMGSADSADSADYAADDSNDFRYSLLLRNNDVSVEGVLSLLKAVFKTKAPIYALELQDNSPFEADSDAMFKLASELTAYLSESEMGGDLDHLHLGRPWGISSRDTHVPFGPPVGLPSPPPTPPRINDHDVVIIAAVLAKHSSATCLDLSNNQLTASSLALIAKHVLQRHAGSKISTLRLNDNAWISPTLHVPSEALLSATSTLRSRRSTKKNKASKAFFPSGDIDPVGTETDPTGIKELAKALQLPSSVTSLDLSSCSLGTTGPASESPIHIICNKLTEENKAGEKGCELKSLWLASNELDTESEAIINALKNDAFCSLTMLDLSNNKNLLLDLKAATDFKDALANGRHCLSVLSLRNTGISNNNSKPLSKIVTSTPQLVELDLSENNLGDDGMRYWYLQLDSAEAAIERLAMSDCGLSEQACLRRFAFLVNRKPTAGSETRTKNERLRRVNLSKNGDDAHCDTIESGGRGSSAIVNVDAADPPQEPSAERRQSLLQTTKADDSMLDDLLENLTTFSEIPLDIWNTAFGQDRDLFGREKDVQSLRIQVRQRSAADCEVARPLPSSSTATYTNPTNQHTRSLAPPQTDTFVLMLVIEEGEPTLHTRVLDLERKESAAFINKKRVKSDGEGLAEGDPEDQEDDQGDSKLGGTHWAEALVQVSKLSKSDQKNYIKEKMYPDPEHNVYFTKIPLPHEAAFEKEMVLVQALVKNKYALTIKSPKACSKMKVMSSMRETEVSGRASPVQQSARLERSVRSKNSLQKLEVHSKFGSLGAKVSASHPCERGELKKELAATAHEQPPSFVLTERARPSAAGAGDRGGHERSKHTSFCGGNWLARGGSGLARGQERNGGKSETRAKKTPFCVGNRFAISRRVLLRRKRASEGARAKQAHVLLRWKLARA